MNSITGKKMIARNYESCIRNDRNKNIQEELNSRGKKALGMGEGCNLVGCMIVYMCWNMRGETSRSGSSRQAIQRALRGKYHYFLTRRDTPCSRYSNLSK